MSVTDTWGAMAAHWPTSPTLDLGLTAGNS